MKIVLKTDVEGLGQAGDVVTVADGYARNYLIPKGLAIPAHKGARKQAEQIKAAAEKRRQRQRQTAISFAEKLQALTLTFRARAAETERLFGSITAADIALAIEQATGEPIDKRLIQLERPIRQLGTHAVPVRLMADVVPEVTVIVEREGELPAASEATEQDEPAQAEAEAPAEEQAATG